MPGNWKVDAVVKALGDAGHALLAHDFAPLLGMTSKQVSNYIKHNMLHKYVVAEKIPINGRGPAPWLNIYTLTEIGVALYRRRLS